MTFLTTDYTENKSNDYGVLPTGNYEMIIAKAQETSTKSGAESLQIDLIVRNDLDSVPHWLKPTRNTTIDMCLWITGNAKKLINMTCKGSNTFLMQSACRRNTD